MPSDPQRPSWWRIPSPSMLLLVLLLSFLPWVEVGCENKVNMEKSARRPSRRYEGLGLELGR